MGTTTSSPLLPHVIALRRLAVRTPDLSDRGIINDAADAFAWARIDLDRAREIMSAILAADERGQGVGFAEGMNAAKAFVEGKR